MTAVEHVPVILIGAGISGIGAAHHLQEQCPNKPFLLLEEKESFGGTWLTHTYPGIRSDSDLYTFGFRFKPWVGPPIASGDSILQYLREVIEASNLGSKIRYGQRIVGADWSTADQQWSLTVERTDSGEQIHYTCAFLLWTGGYYDHHEGYTPDWPGFSDYQGEVIHPQTWPEDTSLKGKRVIVIGSGATAATLIPNISDDCEHVTMLQRSPTYFWTGENRNELADRLRKLDLPEEWVHEIVRRDLLQNSKEIQYASANFPKETRAELLKGVSAYVGEEITEKHFSPSYRPWHQRLAYVPDGDLFNAVKSGRATIVTDHIDHFTETGIALQSGEHLEADVVITATGFNLQVIGGIPYSVDGELLNPADSVTYRGIMMTGYPNFAQIFGYLRTSWTMRVDLVADYICRLLNHMDAVDATSVIPVLRQEDQDMAVRRWIDEDEFDPGYMRRGAHLMPKSGLSEPWAFSPDYYVEKEQMPLFDLEEDVLHYEFGATS